MAFLVLAWFEPTRFGHEAGWFKLLQYHEAELPHLCLRYSAKMYRKPSGSSALQSAVIN
ncbi:hypothetical protein KEM60_03085 [Austwickia sp. TVS 96-490-7B]|uniref:hypothetical protein n=1 Tax=Austwickia sp. TVS 96-490-7B TaxID=2830843 RepID=UPI001C5623E4|nr:hypothetical protein [Austwickia sp. TVS 96-490-7B]MBW3086856.1 hypothetical protein [Austwickia sp. TVS 96-490-7B]